MRNFSQLWSRDFLGKLIIAISATISVPSIQAGVINFSSFESSVSENSATVTVTVTRTGSVSQEASVTIIAESGSAKSPADFNVATTTLTWGSGDSAAKTLDVEIIDDRLIEGAESFRLNLDNVVGDIIGAFKTHDVTIIDFEEGRIQFDAAVYTASENSGTLPVTVIRTGGTDGDITVELKTSDVTAVNGDDYVETSIVLSLLDGQARAEAFIGLANDQVAELEEQFQLTLSNPTGNATLGSLINATARITDLDSQLDQYSTYIDPSSEYIVKSGVLDLINSKFSDSDRFIDLINNISVFKTSKINLVQQSNGMVRADVGDSAYFFWPTEVNRNTVSQSSALLIAAGDSARLYTDHDLIFTLQPALAGINIFQSWLSSIGIPDIVIADSGSITVRADQGPPKFVTKVNGEIVLANSYFDRWNLRPEGPANKVDFAYEGVEVYPHPFYPSESVVSVFFKDGTVYRQQNLSPAPFDPSELQQRLEARIQYRNVEFLGYGTIEFSLLGDSLLFPGAEKITILSDIKVRKSEGFEPGDAGFFPYIDINGDGLVDFKMVYSTGDEQFFLTKGYR